MLQKLHVCVDYNINNNKKGLVDKPFFYDININMEFILKAIIGGLIVAGVVTAAQRGNPTLGALILGIPLGSIISIIFMYYSGVDVKVFQQLAQETIYFVLVSLVFFPMFVYTLNHWNFWISLLSSISVTMVALLFLKHYLES